MTAPSITHQLVASDPQTPLIGATDWNNTHTMTTIGSNVILGAITAGAVQELTAAQVATIVGGGAGSDTQFIFNNAGSLAGAANFTYINATGQISLSTAGGASASAFNLTGTPFAGTGTTSTPLAYFNNAVTQPTTWSTASTYLGINAASGFTGNFLDFRINGGAVVFSVNATGGTVFNGATAAFNGSGISNTGTFTSTSAAGASKAAIVLTGALFTGGTGTTTFPQYLAQPSAATAATTWSTAGTVFGANEASGFGGMFLDFRVNGGTTLFNVNNAGNMACGTINCSTINGTGRYTNNSPGVAPIDLTGALATGTGTTAFGQITAQNVATAVSTWNTNGTYYAINANSGFAGNFLDFHVNGATSAFFVASTGTISTIGNIIVGTAGNGLQIQSGSNARIGTGTLSGGTLAVANTSVTANTRVFLQDTNAGALTNVGSLTVVTSAGVGFTVTSTNVLDTSTFNYLLIESN